MFLCFSRLFTPWVDLHHDRLTWIVAHACPLPWPSLTLSFPFTSIRLERAKLCQAQKLRSLKLKQYEACWNHLAISSSSSVSMWQPLCHSFLSVPQRNQPVKCVSHKSLKNSLVSVSQSRSSRFYYILLWREGREGTWEVWSTGAEWHEWPNSPMIQND